MYPPTSHAAQHGIESTCCWSHCIDISIQVQSLTAHNHYFLGVALIFSIKVHPIQDLTVTQGKWSLLKWL